MGEPKTCEFDLHVSQPGHRRCDCGERPNPAWRSLWNRTVDKVQFKYNQRRRRKIRQAPAQRRQQ